MCELLKSEGKTIRNKLAERQNNERERERKIEQMIRKSNYFYR